ncbi:MAG: dihydrodipicolinate synthase family protein [Sphaerochaeta sp.]|jgi:dihydrodipicolinate synthase/N-acetylneuraminate lyase|uniref:dihydrodipicolinate synthase family protein n=1 Tax=Sphaerochaeta sp. TaxID=1972642 RepID=UPI003D1003C5
MTEMNKKLVCPVLPTPFTDDGEAVDYKQFALIVRWACENGADRLVLFGGASECYKLSREEKIGLVETACREAAGFSIPVMATLCEQGTRIAVEEARDFIRGGATMINIMPPSFANPSSSMIGDHVEGICRELGQVAVMIQYAPDLTGKGLNIAFVASLCRSHNTINMVKVEKQPVGPVVSSLKEILGHDTEIAIGNGGFHCLDAFSRGASSVMPGLACLRSFRAFCDAFNKGRSQDAENIYKLMSAYIFYNFRHIEAFTAIEKHILYKKGLLKNSIMRTPSLPAPDEWSLAYVDRVCKEMGEL